MLKKIEAMKMYDNLDMKTGEFLESGFDITIPPMIISFNGKTIRVPMDYADFNNAATEFLQELIDICKDYEEWNIGDEEE